MSYAFMSLLKFSFLTLLLAHWLACLWGFISIAGDGEWTGYDSGYSWRQKANIPSNASAYDIYGISLYVSLNNIFGGSCEINPGNYAEFFVQAAMLARFTPNQTPFLVLKVPRASLLEDSLAFLRSVPDSDLTKELKIEFVAVWNQPMS